MFPEVEQRFGPVRQVVEELASAHQDPEARFRQQFRTAKTQIPVGIKHSLVLLYQIQDAGRVHRPKSGARSPPGGR